MAHTVQTGQYQNEPAILEPVDIEIGAVEIKDGLADTRATVEAVGGGKFGLVVSTAAAGALTNIVGNTQLFVLDTASALGALGTFSTTTKIMSTQESLGVSVHLLRGAGDVVVDIIVEQAETAIFRELFSQRFTLTVADPQVEFNQVFSATRSRMRVRLVNNTATALGETDVVTTQKPIS